jgi:glycosyltransferase involved in cell wall biosynthesis
MKLSIIIPYYNGMDKIKPCLESIISQNLDPNDYEIIIVDDCSPQRCLKENIVAMLPPPR